MTGKEFLKRAAPNSDYSRVVVPSIEDFKEGDLVGTKDGKRNGIVKAIVTGPAIAIQTALSSWMWYAPEDLIPAGKE